MENKEYRKRYREKFPERVKESQTKWRLKNKDYDKKRVLTEKQKERKKEKNKIWRLNNKNKIRKNKNKYRKNKGRKVETIRRYSKQFLEKFLRKFVGNKCQKCADIENLEVHHLIYDNDLQKEIYKKLKMGNGKKELLEILMLLCEKCHIKEHGG